MSGQPEEKKRVTPANVLQAVTVVAIVQLVALLITLRNLPTYQAIVQSGGSSFAPAGTTPAGSALNAIFLVAFAFVATLALVRILRRKMVFSFKVLVFGSVAISAFLLTLVTADDVVYQYVPPDVEGPLVFGVSLLVVALIAYTIFVKNRPWLSTVILAFVGAEVGSFFGVTLNLETALLLPIAFSLYDIYAVFRGPLKQLVGMGQSVALVGMSIRAGEFTLGLGDVVFYTMLPSIALAQLSRTASVGMAATTAVATMGVIDVGVVMTLYLLSKKRLLPGLPIPMLLGVLALGIFLL